MSKLPMETRPLRLAPSLVGVVEGLLKPYSGKKLEAAQDAVLRVYRSGAQMDHAGWVRAYTEAIDVATTERKAVAAS